MKRFPTGLLALCLIGSVMAQEPKAAEAEYLKTFRGVRDDVDAKMKPIYEKVEKAYESAKSEADRAKIETAMRRDTEAVLTPALEKIAAAVKPHASEKDAVEPLIWLATRVRGGDELLAYEWLEKHHAVRPETLELANQMKRSGIPSVEKLLRVQLAHPDLPKDKAWRVRLSLAVCLQNQAALPALLNDASADDATLYESVFGKAQVAAMKKYDAAKYEAEAVKLFRELQKAHGDEDIVPGLKVATVAKSSIYEMENLGIGKMAPEIEGEDLDGAKFKLSDYRGKVVFLSFWASWCGPCLALIPHEREIVEKFQGRPFALIGVNGDPEKKDLKKVLTENKITWRSFWSGEKGPEGPIPEAWNVSGWPTMYVIDAKGIIRGKQLRGKKLEERIESLVKGTEATGK